MAGGNTVCDVCPAGSFGNTTGSRKRIKGVPARQHFGRSSTQRRYLLSVRGQTSIQWPARLLLQFGSGRQGCCLLTETSMCPAGAVICQPCLPGTFFLYDGAFIALPARCLTRVWRARSSAECLGCFLQLSTFKLPTRLVFLHAARLNASPFTPPGVIPGDDDLVCRGNCVHGMRTGVLYALVG